MTSRDGAKAPVTDRTDFGPPPLRIDVQAEPGAVCISPVGEIDLGTVGTIRRTIDECVRAGYERIVIDLRGVTFLDCTGVHLALEADASARAAGCEPLLIEGPPLVQRVFELVGVRDRLPFIEAPHLLISESSPSRSFDSHREPAG